MSASLNATVACQQPLQPVAASVFNYDAHNKPSRTTSNKTHVQTLMKQISLNNLSLQLRLFKSAL